VTSTTSTPPVSYLDRLLAELDAIHEQYNVVLDASGVRNINPNRRGSGGIFVGFPSWGWLKSEPALEAARMTLLGTVRDWTPRFRLLFAHPTPTVAKRLDDGLAHLERWLTREDGDHSVPSGISQGHELLAATVQDLRALTDLLPIDEYPVRLVVDANVLIDNPDVAVYTNQIGIHYRVHLLPVVMGEIDDLKRSGRVQELRDAAKRADRYLKELRRRGDVRAGVRVAGKVSAVFEYAEPKADDLPSWLDLNVPDDRFVAAALLLQSGHPGSALYVATSDLNLQNKLGAVGLPFVEPLSED